MKQSIGSLARLLVPALVVAGLCVQPAMAQDKAKDAKPAAKEEKKGDGKFSQKVLQEDDRLRVNETTYKPGGSGPSVQRGYRVTRALKGGTFERTYADGRKEKVERKTGSVMIQGPDKEAYSNKNIGKSDIVIYGVNIKSPKK